MTYIDTCMFVQCTKSVSGLCCRLYFFQTVWSSVQKLSGLSASRRGEKCPPPPVKQPN